MALLSTILPLQLLSSVKSLHRFLNTFYSAHGGTCCSLLWLGCASKLETVSLRPTASVKVPD